MDKEIASKRIISSSFQDPKAKVESRMVELFSLKAHRVPLVKKYRQEYRVNDVDWGKVGDAVNFHMNTGFALVNSKAAEILSSTPFYDFLAMDEEAKKNKKVRELFWKWLWTTSKTDQEVYRIIIDALICGSGYGIEEVVEETRCVKVPYKKNGKILYKEKDISDYSGCRLTYIPWENVLINGTNIENSTEFIYFKEYYRDEFFQIFGNNQYFSNISESTIPKWKYYYIADDDKLTLSSSTTWVENWMKVNVAKYYNKDTDEYIVLANGVWINPGDKKVEDKVESYEVLPIPYSHKQLPVVQFTDHMIMNDINGIGEFDITNGSRAIKNETRSMMIEVVRAQAGIITIDPDADWDETTMKLGMRQAARVRKEDVGFFAPNINSATIQQLEAKIDDDIIIETGTDFKNQLLSSLETATRTAGRIDAAKKRINLMMKYNAYTFFERLARLRMANMETYYSDFKGKIWIKGMDISDDGVVEEISGGYGIFTFKPDYLKWKFLILPVMDSLMADSSERQKQKFMEFVQIVANMVDPETGKPLIHPKQILEAGKGVIDDVVDIEKMLQKAPVDKTPEQLMQEAWIMEGMGMEWNPNMPEAQPGYVPPSQRSWAPVILPSSPNLWM